MVRLTVAYELADGHRIVQHREAEAPDDLSRCEATLAFVGATLEKVAFARLDLTRIEFELRNVRAYDLLKPESDLERTEKESAILVLLAKHELELPADVQYRLVAEPELRELVQ